MDHSLLTTGSSDFDTLLGGGLPSRQTIIVAGDPGSGKTLLCSQVAFLTAARGLPVVMASVTSEPHDKLMAELSGFSFFKQELVGEQVFLISTYAYLKKGPKETREVLLQVVRERGAKLLFIDGLRAIRDLWQDEARLREFLYELGIGLTSLGCIGLFSTEYPIEKLMTLPEATTVDGIVSLEFPRTGVRRRRLIEVVKLRGRPHLIGQHLFSIGSDGVEIVPRIESDVPSDEHFVAPEGRASFGLPELDALLSGGLPLVSATVIAGSMGVGKTLTAAHFAVESARQGEKVLLVSFFEPPGSLAGRSRRIGLDLEGPVKAGLVRPLYMPAAETEADFLVRRILAELRALGAKRLVVDSLTDLEASITGQGRAHDFLAALLVELRLMGVTTVFTKEVTKVTGPELDFTETPVALLGENLILLRQVELRSKLHRILTVLKMRDSRYLSDVREFEITDGGIRVLAPMRSAEGLLTGQARSIGSAGASGQPS